MLKNNRLYIQEAQWIPSLINANRYIKTGKKILKTREKQLTTYKGTPVRFIVDLLAETRGQEGNTNTYSKSSKKKTCQPKIIYPI